MQLCRHSNVAVADFLAKLPQIHQETERVGFVGGLTHGNKRRTMRRLSQGEMADGPRQTKRMASQAR
jgi:hypothetical protein